MSSTNMDNNMGESGDHKNFGLNNLPNELLLNIFEYLLPTDLKQVRLVCKHWRELTYLPKFLNKFKLIINSKNVTHIYERIQNNVELTSICAYETITFHERQLSKELRVVFKLLGQNACSLTFPNSELSPLLTDYYPKLRELNYYDDPWPTVDIIFNLDLKKFKNLKSLDIRRIPPNLLVSTFLLKQLKSEPLLNMNKLGLSTTGTLEHNELVMEVLQCHSNSLIHLDLFLLNHPDKVSQWKHVFSLLKKLKTLKITGNYTYDWLKNIIEGLPKENRVRNCDLDCAFHLDDLLFKLIIDKFSESLEVINMTDCDKLTNGGIHHLYKLRKTLKSLNFSSFKGISAVNVIKGLAAEKNTTLNALALVNMWDNTQCIEPFVKCLPNMTNLNLDGCRRSVDNNTLQSIFQHQTKLQHLNLNCCTQITDRGLIGFNINPAPISNLKGLQSLSLMYCNNITDTGLIQAFKFKELRSLTLGYCHNITAGGIETLVKNCPALEKLTICSCSKIDDKAIFYIAQGLRRLKYLNINNCDKITGKSLDHIIEFCKNLKWLDTNLNGCENRDKFWILNQLNIETEIFYKLFKGG